MNATLLSALFFLIFSLNSIEAADLPEMVIGAEQISPGIDLVFEAAIKDDVAPLSNFLAKNETDIHIEVLANWNNDAPSGSPEGGFIAYLNVKVDILNQKSQVTKTIDLLPHINLIDNYHYANNIKLPGSVEDIYTVTFYITPPESGAVGMHLDWRNQVNENIITGVEYTFENLNFSEIATANRR